MKIIVASDSFKGSLSAVQVGEIVGAAFRRVMPDADIVRVPLADGGEGTVDALVAAAGGRTETLTVTGPYGERAECAFGIIEPRRARDGGEAGKAALSSGGEPVSAPSSGGTTASADSSGGEAVFATGPTARTGTPLTERTAVLEAASVFGITMAPKDRMNPLQATTRGMGEAIRQLLDLGFRRFIVGLGGSATNDGGMGMLAALGASFADAAGRPLEGYGRDLAEAASADLAGLDERLRECDILVACDVSNPLCGPEGASHVYGPQKGAAPEMVAALDRAMRGYAALVEAGLGGAPLAETPGAGAAGGAGFALLALGARMLPGAAVIEEAASLSAHLRGSDWVVTGEGRSDGQTAFGKLPYYVAQRAREAGAGAILLSGSLGEGWEALLGHFDGCFAAVTRPATLQQCLEQAERSLAVCAESVARLIARASGAGVRPAAGK